MQIQKITLIGTGNVAQVLGKLFITHGISIVQVYGRNKNAAEQIAQLLNASACNNLNKLNYDTHLFILCISDDAIETLAQKINTKNIPIVHTAGAVAMDVLQKGKRPYGVLYPLQSLNSQSNKTPKIPFIINANDINLELALMQLAKQVKSKVSVCNNQLKLAIHLAAVFCNNFSNYMYYCGEQISQANGFDFKLLVPIIMETAQRLNFASPAQVQTGPAKRGDKKTQQKHLALLKYQPELMDIYKLLSAAIAKNLSNS